MDAELYVGRVLDDEGLRGDLNDTDATALVDRLVVLVGEIARTAKTEDEAWARVTTLCQSGRAIARSVSRFESGDQAEARRIAESAHLSWPAQDPTSATNLLRHFLAQLIAA